MSLKLKFEELDQIINENIKDARDEYRTYIVKWVHKILRKSASASKYANALSGSFKVYLWFDDQCNEDDYYSIAAELLNLNYELIGLTDLNIFGVLLNRFELRKINAVTDDIFQKFNGEGRRYGIQIRYLDVDQTGVNRYVAIRVDKNHVK